MVEFKDNMISNVDINTNNIILNYIIWDNKVDNKFYIENFGKKKIKNWNSLINSLEQNNLNTSEQLKTIIAIIQYIESDKRRKFLIDNLKINLWNYKIEWSDDILHIMMSSYLSNKIGDNILLILSRIKELSFDYPKYKEKINNNNNNNNNTYKWFNKLEWTIRNTLKKRLLVQMNDSIQDMKSNIVWTMLRNFLEENTSKTISDFFSEFKSSTDLQNKFIDLQDKEWLIIKWLELIKNN